MVINYIIKLDNIITDWAALLVIEGIISNFRCSDFAKEHVVDACKLTLKNLQLDYLDLYLVSTSD